MYIFNTIISHFCFTGYKGKKLEEGWTWKLKEIH